MLNPLKSSTTLKEIKKIELVAPPNAGKDWRGVPHAHLLTEVARTAQAKGLDLKLHAAHTGRHDYDLAAGLILAQLTVPGLPPLPDGWRYGLGIATSNANRYRLRFYVGAYRPEDENNETWTALAVHSYRAEKRYTAQFDLPAEAATAVDRWLASARKLHLRLKKLEAHKFTRADAEALLVAAAQAGFTPPSRAFQAMRLLPDGRVSALDLLAAFGATAAKNPPDVQQDQLLGFFRTVRDRITTAKAK